MNFSLKANHKTSTDPMFPGTWWMETWDRLARAGTKRMFTNEPEPDQGGGGRKEGHMLFLFSSL